MASVELTVVVTVENRCGSRIFWKGGFKSSKCVCVWGGGGGGVIFQQSNLIFHEFLNGTESFGLGGGGGGGIERTNEPQPHLNPPLQ